MKNDRMRGSLWTPPPRWRLVASLHGQLRRWPLQRTTFCACWQAQGCARTHDRCGEQQVAGIECAYMEIDENGRGCRDQRDGRQERACGDPWPRGDEGEQHRHG